MIGFVKHGIRMGIDDFKLKEKIAEDNEFVEELFKENIKFIEESTIILL